ncbi:hypothetical protein [Dawidia soli]|uniref:Uncharacterized protein n=1 Tax=Dawidia soli TaxID=2782352 RepID=A0AAP2D563_9BACT|nr:hypothetical protein [Dawidia soli]MBT1685546.1 hypothetical protein [Dawidia soli]
MEEIISEGVLSMLPVLFNVVLQLAMLIVPIYCISKRPTAPAYLMLIGAVLGLPGVFFSTWWNLWGINLNMPAENITRYFMLFGAISFLASLAFAFGFLLFVYGALRKRASF